MTPADLWQAFHAGDVSEPELSSVLLNHYHSAALISQHEIVYPDAEHCALKLVYREEALERIEAGPALKDEDVTSIKARIEEALLHPVGQRVRRTIFFSMLPVNGWWRYRDRFQILPPPTGAPTPGVALGEHPFRLESRFVDTPDRHLRVTRGIAEAAEIGLLLSVLVEGFVRCPDNAARKHWVYRRLEEGGELQSEYAQEGYTAPGFSHDAENYTPTTGIPPMREVPPVDYYNRRGIGGSPTLEIPSSIGRCLDRFYAWSGQERTRYLRACHWFRHAQIVRSYSASASFVALIHAVEAVMPPIPAGAPQCLECKRVKGPGPRARFVQFLDAQAPGLGPVAQSRRLLYDVRSDILHRGELLWTDSRGWYAGLHPLYGQQLERASEAWQVCRLALVNYLNGSPL